MDDTLYHHLVSGQRRALAKAITLIESRNARDRARAEELLERIMPHTGRSLRIGITGVPGVGKSTFIEAFGMRMLQDHRLAVLAIDPSSPVTGGSILGDKTRMQNLSREDGAFIRPSPAGGALGGVGRYTREAILLCEAAGYPIVIVETVGVGQSEAQVASMVDLFLFLQMPATGDELQGIKKGVLELADLIVVTKNDGDLVSAAKRAKAEHDRVLELVYPDPETRPKVLLCSSVTGDGLPEVWNEIHSFKGRQQSSGRWKARRDKQSLSWFEQEIDAQLKDRFLRNATACQQLSRERSEILERGKPASLAAKAVVDSVFAP